MRSAAFTPKRGGKASPKDSYVKESHLGIPALMPFTLKGKEYQRYDDEGKLVKENQTDLRMPLSTLVTVSRQKEVQYTSVSAGQTTIKEMSGFQDWDIKVQGLFLNEQGQPQDHETITAQMQALLAYEQVAESIEVSGGWLFDLADIHRLFIESVEIKPLQGRNKISGFAMNCKSDEPYEIELKMKS